MSPEIPIFSRFQISGIFFPVLFLAPVVEKNYFFWKMVLLWYKQHHIKKWKKIQSVSIVLCLILTGIGSLIYIFMNVRSYCAEYYLLSDTEYCLKVFWLIYVHVILCIQKSLCMHVTGMLVTVHTIHWALLGTIS